MNDNLLMLIAAFALAPLAATAIYYASRLRGLSNAVELRRKQYEALYSQFKTLSDVARTRLEKIAEQERVIRHLARRLEEIKPPIRVSPDIDILPNRKKQ